MQYTPPLVEPMGERRSAWWVISQFMRRAGLPVPDYVLDDDRDEGVDDFMLAQLFKRAALQLRGAQGRSSYVEFPLEFPAPWAEKHFERIGGWRARTARVARAVARLARHRRGATSASRSRWSYTSRRQVKKLNAQLSFMGEPADIFLHPDTAADHGIADGQKVRVHNKSGEITVTAKVDPDMRKGVCSIPHGHLHANVNNLTSTDDVDPLGGMALYSGVPIEIELSI